MNQSRVVDFISIRSHWCYGHYMPAWRSLPGCTEHSSNVIWALSTTLPWGRARPSFFFPSAPSFFYLSLIKGLGALSEFNLYFVICGPTSVFTYLLPPQGAEDSFGKACFFLVKESPLVRWAPAISWTLHSLLVALPHTITSPARVSSFPGVPQCKSKTARLETEKSCLLNFFKGTACAELNSAAGAV